MPSGRSLPPPLSRKCRRKGLGSKEPFHELSYNVVLGRFCAATVPVRVFLSEPRGCREEAPASHLVAGVLGLTILVTGARTGCLRFCLSSPLRGLLWRC